MPKKVFVYRNGEMVEKQDVLRPVVHDIMPDLPDFVSTVDGRVIHGRRGLREHNKELGVTNPADYKDTWANFQKKREALFQGRDSDPRRTQAIARAFTDLQEGRRSRR
jgi:hypothetical protein